MALAFSGSGPDLGAKEYNLTDPPPDTSPPTTSDHSPAKGAAGVSRTADISLTISDSGDGVDISTIQLTEEGNLHCCSGQTCTGGTADLTCTGSPASYDVTLSSRNYSYDQEVNVSIDASDLADTPNDMTTETYSYTVESESQSTEFYFSVPGNLTINIIVGDGNLDVQAK